MKIRHDQRGIAHWLIIVIILLLLAIGFAGWRVWEAKSDDAEPAATVSDSSAEDEAEAPKNYIQPPSEAYRAALPEGWVSGTCPDTPNLLFMAPTSDLLGKCNSESAGTVIISRSDGNTGYGEDYYTANVYYGGVTYTPVTIDGIAGYKVAYTIATADELGYPPVGTEVVQYVLFDGTNTYSVTYTRFASDPDNAAAAQAIAESFDVI